MVASVWSLRTWASLLSFIGIPMVLVSFPMVVMSDVANE